MRYINAKTGAIVEVSSVLGGDWKPVEKKESPKKETPKKKATPKKED